MKTATGKKAKMNIKTEKKIKYNAGAVAEVLDQNPKWQV